MRFQFLMTTGPCCVAAAGTGTSKTDNPIATARRYILLSFRRPIISALRDFAEAAVAPGMKLRLHSVVERGAVMLKIWGRNTSSNVQKVLWCCEELGIEFERVDVGGPFGGNNDPEYLALNP